MKLPDFLKAGVATAIFTFVTGFGATVVGWLNDVMGWATRSGEVPFPDPSVLRGALFSVGAGALVGLVNTVIRGLQEKWRIGNTPDYTPADGDLTGG